MTMERRSLPGSLRYLAGKLTGGTDPVHVALTHWECSPQNWTGRKGRA